MGMLVRVSLSAVDDGVSMSDIANFSTVFPFIEWGIMYTPHNEGAPRNPTKYWREMFFEKILTGNSAVHLCGSLAFEHLINGTLPEEIEFADRIQLNVNARRIEFNDEQVMDIYHKAMNLGVGIILQYNENTAENIKAFLPELDQFEIQRVSILLDESRGTGIYPEKWSVPEFLNDYVGKYNTGLKGIPVGFAGGINPDNVTQALKDIQELDYIKRSKNQLYWIDMESGIRTDNKFDLIKAAAVLNSTKETCSSIAAYF